MRILKHYQMENFRILIKYMNVFFRHQYMKYYTHLENFFSDDQYFYLKMKLIQLFLEQIRILNFYLVFFLLKKCIKAMDTIIPDVSLFAICG